MAALILVNGTAGSKTSIIYGSTINLANANNTGVTTWNWYLLSQPYGTPTDTLTTPTSPTSTFTASKEGSYLVKLVVNAGLAGEATDQVVVAVRELETSNRIPAAGETTEVSPTEGWANLSLNPILQTVTRLQNNGIIAGVLSASFVGTLTAGTLVYVSGDTTLGANENERRVPIFDKALATTQAHMNGVLGLFLKNVTAGGGTAVANDRIQVQLLGAFPNTFTMAAGGAIGDKVYASDTGTLSLTAGTISRHLGTVSYVSGTTYRVFFVGYDGGASGSSTPTGPAGGVLSGTYPNPSALQAAATTHLIPLAVGSGNVAGDPIIFKSQDGTGSAKGSDLKLQAGSGLGTGAGGDIIIASGVSSTTISGAILISTPNAVEAGPITVSVGGTSTGTGSDLTLTAGAASDTGFSGGSAYLRAGNTSNTSNAVGGDAVIQGGVVSAYNNTAAVIRVGGATYNGINPKGGDAVISAGDATTIGGIGGNVSITAGDSSSAGITAFGGNVTIEAGNSTNAQGGSITIQGGSSNAAFATGGTVNILGGTNGEGRVNINARNTAGVYIGRPATGITVQTVHLGISGFGIYNYGRLILVSEDAVITLVTDVISSIAPTIRLRPNGNYTLTSAPTVSAGTARGQRILLVNMSPTYSITLNKHGYTGINSTLILGANQRVLSQYGVLDLQWELDETGNNGRWLEVAFRS